MRDHDYPGRERRRFRRVDLRFPVAVERVSSASSQESEWAEGTTLNLSFGGALVALESTSGLQGATPVRIRFVDTDSVAPVCTDAVVWRAAEGEDPDRVAVEFEQPLFAYEGAIELADRLEWLRGMGGDELCTDVVAQFLDSIPHDVRRAERGCEQRDFPVVAEAAKALKSSAGNIGAVNLYEAGRRAERAALAGDGTTTTHFVELLRQYFDAVKRDLRRLGMA